MAMFLKRFYQLLTLKVSCQFESEPAAVKLELERYHDGQCVVENCWNLTTSDLGMSNLMSGVGTSSLGLPDSVLAPLRETLDEHKSPDNDGPEVLWLHLIKPYGLLGALDWEGALTKAIGRPVLRLPDFLEPPVEQKSVFNAALICDLPSDEAPYDLVDQIATLARCLAQSIHRPEKRIHVFVPARWSKEIEKVIDLRLPPLGPAVITVHHAADAHTTPVTWQGWIQDSLQGKALDLMHFVAHAWQLDQRPALAFSASPQIRADGMRTSNPLYATQVAQLLTRTGAWAAGFSAPKGSSEVLMRLFADTLAQTRPGPVLYQPPQNKTSIRTFAAWVDFLFSGRPARPPLSASGFAYCQPQMVQGYEGLSTPTVPSGYFSLTRPKLETIGFKPDPDGPAELAQFVASSDKAWLSVAQRFVEQESLQKARWASTDISDLTSEFLNSTAFNAPNLEAISSSQTTADALDNTLSDLSRIVSAHARLSEGE